MKKILLVSALATLVLSGCKKAPEFTYQMEKVERQDIMTSVTATGTIEPVTSVQVGTQVSGIVSKLYVDYNSVVKAGQVIAELDRTNLLSELSSMQANLKSTESELAYQKKNHERYSKLFEKGLIAADEYDKVALALTQCQMRVNQQRESVKKAQTNLGYATITSPIDGVILSKEVEEGQTVAASFNTPTLFTIAQDLTQMRVIADVDEADIGEVKEGQRVSFTVDAFPNDVFSGQVQQVRQQATTTSNVVTYEVVITAPNDDLKLKPGLTANVTIYTLELNDCIAVSNKALRFTPVAGMMPSEDEIVDCDGHKKLWVKEGNKVKAVAIETGISNGMLTEVVKGLNEGAEVICDVTSNVIEEEPEQMRNPFMPKPKEKKDKEKK